MLQAILVWSGAVLATGLLLLMALGPAIVEADSWWYERKLNRMAKKVERPAVATQAAPARRVVHPAA